MSTAYHSQIDGQTEIVNKNLEQYLKAFASDRPHRWAEWLSLAEFWFNTNFHTALKLSPLEALYAFPPPKLQAYVPGTTRVDAVDTLLQQRQEVLSLLKDNLVAAQEKKRLQADKYCTARSLQAGEWVYLSLQPYK